jgi:sugar phosphate isomerase/epimerase
MVRSQPVFLAYCTNVHAGADLESTLVNLQQHAVAVKANVAPDQPMGIGLWLAAKAARQLAESGRSRELAAWLDERGLIPVTLNGFPYGNFHQAVVKYDVYQPTWFDPARVAYTRDLIRILDTVLPAGLEGSLSTLPIAWNRPRPDRDQLALAARHLADLAGELHQLEQRTGRLIYLCLEPEPGCVLQRCDDVLRFFREHLYLNRDPELVNRYLRVCHDVCHTAVMYEDQAHVLQRYAEAGIAVGKVQVSSAIELDLRTMPAEQRMEARRQLAQFAEDRYLHQTTIRQAGVRELRFHDDLPLALAATTGHEPVDSQWRVHFHVPIHVPQLGALKSTRDDILSCLRAARCQPQLCHFEVETYAWSVLPSELRQTELAAGIAAELLWLADQAEFQQLRGEHSSP